MLPILLPNNFEWHVFTAYLFFRTLTQTHVFMSVSVLCVCTPAYALVTEGCQMSCSVTLDTIPTERRSLSECGAKLVAKQAPVILLSQPHTVLGFQASMPQSKQIVFLIYRWICLCVWMDPSCSNTHVKVRGYLVARLPLLSCWF